MDGITAIKQSKYFHIKEFIRHYEPVKISPELIFALDRFREYLGLPICPSPNIKSFYAIDGHCKNSIHYQGLAGDVFPKCDIYYAFQKALEFGEFTGIGIYPWFSWKSNCLQGMLHLDLREFSMGTRTWWVDKSKHYHYFGKEDIQLFYNLYPEYRAEYHIVRGDYGTV